MNTIERNKQMTDKELIALGAKVKQLESKYYQEMISDPKKILGIKEVSNVSLARAALEAVTQETNIPITQMSLVDIFIKFQNEVSLRDEKHHIAELCARLVHELAQSVSKVDPDAEAKRLAWEWYSHEYFCGLFRNAEDLWSQMVDSNKNRWRAVVKAIGEKNQ